MEAVSHLLIADVCLYSGREKQATAELLVFQKRGRRGV